MLSKQLLISPSMPHRYGVANVNHLLPLLEDACSCGDRLLNAGERSPRRESLQSPDRDRCTFRTHHH